MILSHPVIYNGEKKNETFFNKSANSSTYRIKLETSLEKLRTQIIDHPLYNQIQNETMLCRFMEYHVFSVWDFQSLIKALQNELTRTSIPWIPTEDREARRLMNEIILDEESGTHPDGGYTSHFELYLEAMNSAGADSSKIDELIKALREGKTLEENLKSQNFPIQKYLRKTFKVIESNDLIQLIAYFCYGREDIIPDMFRRLIQKLSKKDSNRWKKLEYYFQEHIDCDENRHGPMARAMVERYCGTNKTSWDNAKNSAVEALNQRKNFWDDISKNLFL
jgi:hypothetical protein